MDHAVGRVGMDQGAPRDSYASGAVCLQSMRPSSLSG